MPAFYHKFLTSVFLILCAQLIQMPEAFSQGLVGAPVMHPFNSGETAVIKGPHAVLPGLQFVFLCSIWLGFTLLRLNLGSRITRFFRVLSCVCFILIFPQVMFEYDRHGNPRNPATTFLDLLDFISDHQDKLLWSTYPASTRGRILLNANGTPNPNPVQFVRTDEESLFGGGGW